MAMKAMQKATMSGSKMKAMKKAATKGSKMKAMKGSKKKAAMKGSKKKALRMFPKRRLTRKDRAFEEAHYKVVRAWALLDEALMML